MTLRREVNGASRYLSIQKETALDYCKFSFHFVYMKQTMKMLRKKLVSLLLIIPAAMS